MVGDDDSEAGEEGGQEDTHVADVDGDVEGVEEVVDDCRGDHEAWVDGASDDTTEGIPSPVIKPVVELVKALFCKESRVKKLFNVVSGRKKLLSVVSGGKKLLSVVSGGWKGNNSLGGSVVEVGIKLVNDTLVTQHREQSHAKCYLDGLKYLCHSTIKTTATVRKMHAKTTYIKWQQWRECSSSAGCPAFLSTSSRTRSISDPTAWSFVGARTSFKLKVHLVALNFLI